MLDSKKSNCHFEGEIVSYVYDEMPPDERNEFERHISGCNPCETEVKSFAMISGAVHDWRETEFALIGSPILSRDFIGERVSVASVVSKGARISFLEQIGIFLGNQTAFLKPITAFASLLVFAFAGWYFLGFSSGDVEFAGNQTAPLDSQAIAEVAEQPTGKAGDTDVAAVGDTKGAQTADQLTESGAGNGAEVGSGRKIVPARVVKIKSTRSGIRITRKRIPKKVAPIAAPQVNRLTEAFAIDDSENSDELRLTDLLDELGR